MPESLSSCHDVHCDNPGHSEDADNVIVDILECVDKTAFDSLPVPVNIFSVHDVNKVTPEIVKEAAHNLRDSKSDPTFSFSSDCIKNGPNNLFSVLSTVIKTFLIHGKVSFFLLLATLVPLIKDKLGSITESKNYRSML